MPESATPDRRTFVKRAALASLGAAAAAPLVGARSARAAGTTPAYTDSSNTFVGDQRIDGRLGINTAPGEHHSLDILHARAGWAANVIANEHGLRVRHAVDHAGLTRDLVNLHHTSCGDAIFIAHVGGRPPGFSGEIGGNAGLNVLVPYHIDNTTTGRDGSVVNNRTGMQGLHVETQAVVADSHAIHIGHFSHGYAIRMYVQPPGYPQPVGRGGGIWMDDWSNASGLRITKWNTPNASSEAIVNLRGVPSTPIDALHIRDSADLVRFRVRSDGAYWATLSSLTGAGTVLRTFPSSAPQESFRLTGDGRMAWGPGGSTAVDTNLYRSAADTLRTDDSLHVGQAFRHLGSSLGFYNAAPVSRPTVTGSRDRNNALSNLLNALQQLGLINNNTST